MKHTPLVLLDIETTGASPSYSRITEIGALRIEDGEVVATYQQLINPEIHIPGFITRLTGITDEMVWEAPPFRAIADELEQFLAGSIFVAHHVNFDYGFIKAEYARAGIDFNMDRCCSVRLSRLLHPEQGRHSLDKVIQRLGLDVANRHRAFDDAEVIWKFLQDEYETDKLNLFRAIEKLKVATSLPKPKNDQQTQNLI